MGVRGILSAFILEGREAILIGWVLKKWTVARADTLRETEGERTINNGRI